MKKENKKGFALLVAVIVSTIILTIGLSIINSAIKEVVLASTIRNSITSLYAADTGVECALYWDNFRGNANVKPAFSPSNPPVSSATIECKGITKTFTPAFDIVVPLVDETKPSDSCAEIHILTNGPPAPPPDPDPGDPRQIDPFGHGQQDVKIKSWGYNNCNLGSSKRVDRALQVKYTRYWVL